MMSRLMERNRNEIDFHALKHTVGIFGLSLNLLVPIGFKVFKITLKTLLPSSNDRKIPSTYCSFMLPLIRNTLCK